jgi:predicted DNA-binding transcriptional regulator
LRLPWGKTNPKPEGSNDNKRKISALGGTTLRVYRFLYRQAKPLGVHDIQRGLGLSSFSVAQYHIKKLIADGLVREESGGYVVDRIVFENMIRIRRAVIPIQLGYSAFFSTTLFLLLTVFRPYSITGSYIFSLIVNIAALSLYLVQYVNVTKDMNIS